MAQQASPIYVVYRKEIARELCLEGSREAIERNAILQITGAACGRPGEVATLSSDVMEWDALLGCAVATWPQPKTHKQKQIALMAGANRHVCCLNALGCAFAAGCFGAQLYDPDDLNYLFPWLTEVKSVTGAITSYLKVRPSVC